MKEYFQENIIYYQVIVWTNNIASSTIKLTKQQINLKYLKKP